MSHPLLANQSLDPLHQAPHENMNRQQNRLSQRYAAALRRHLKKNPRTNFESALRLGREAVVLGLETLDLTRSHDGAVATLKLSERRNGFIKRAEIFFTEAIMPIVERHRVARRNKEELNRLNKTLNRRTKELAVTDRELLRGVNQRKVMEDAAEKSEKRHKKCLKESLQLQ